MSVITDLQGMEILDSRGRPTVKGWCRLESGAEGSASVPAGASTGAGEARELRDGDPARFGGLGCRKAAANLRGELRDALRGRAFAGQADLDRALCEIDGTPDKSRLGANALLAASIAFARARAVEGGMPLFREFATALEESGASTVPTIPRPIINLFSGGKHAGGQVAIQDVMILARTAQTMGEALEVAWAIYQAAAERARRVYGMRPLAADEGGLAPDFPDDEVMIREAVEAIAAAGFRPGDEVAIAVDVAASHFFRSERYALGGGMDTTDAMIERLARWVATFPIVLLEDGLAEADWEGWVRLRARIGGRCGIVGDDLLCTNPARIERAVRDGAADALLLKVNQVGTLSEAARARGLARSAGWSVIASARSGETEDDWLADLAVGWATDHIKIGSITRSERLAKYNRLLEIETLMGDR